MLNNFLPSFKNNSVSNMLDDKDANDQIYSFRSGKLSLTVSINTVLIHVLSWIAMVIMVLACVCGVKVVCVCVSMCM